MPAEYTILLAALFGATAASAADRPSLAVVEKVAGRVGFYNSAGVRIGEVKVGNFPHEAVLSPDRRLLYVSDNGVLWMTEDTMGTNTISVVDVVAMKRTAVIDLGRFHRPHGLALDAVSGHLFATTERPHGLIRIDPAARKVVRDYDVKGKSPHMVMLGPGSEWAFVSNVDSNTIAAIQLKTGAVKLLPTAAKPQGGVLSPDGKLLYIVNNDGNSISIVDPKTQEITGTIPTGKGPGRIAITPDGKTLVYNLQVDLAVGFADVASRRQVATLPIGGRSLSLTMTGDGRRAFAGVQDQDKVLVISVPERKVLQTISLPRDSGPDPVIPLT